MSAAAAVAAAEAVAAVVAFAAAAVAVLALDVAAVVAGRTPKNQLPASVAPAREVDGADSTPLLPGIHLLPLSWPCGLHHHPA